MMVDHTAHRNSPSREAFEARIETVEARMDTRVAKIEAKIDIFIAQAAERDVRMAERDRHMVERDSEREKWYAERDKRLEMRAELAQKSAEKAEGLQATLWITSMTTMVAVALATLGTSVASYYATQSSNLAMVQTTISAFQHGQKTLLQP